MAQQVKLLSNLSLIPRIHIKITGENQGYKNHPLIFTHVSWHMVLYTTHMHTHYTHHTYAHEIFKEDKSEVEGKGEPERVTGGLWSKYIIHIMKCHN